jgi:osmoprotectant transport system substrate-binding protein
MVYGTDGGIAAANLVILEDNRHDQPIYAPVPIIREAVLTANPQIRALLAPLMTSFDADTLRELNARVQINGESAQAVAADYLQRKGLLK